MEKKKIKIVQVTFSLDHGGAEMVIFDLVCGLKHLDQKYDSVICSFIKKGTLRKQFKDKNIAVYDVTKSVGKDILLFFKLYKFFKIQKIDIVHAHNGYMWLYSTLPAKLAGAKVVYTEHSVWENPSLSFLICSCIMSFFTDRIIVPSNYVSKLLCEKQKIPKSLIKIIYNGIPAERVESRINFINKRKSLGISNEKIVIGIVARLAEVKDHKCLIDAIYLVLEKGYSVHLLIIGDGEMRQELENKVKRLKLNENISFLGTRNDIGELLKILDIFVLCSKSEGFPISLIESMTVGLPIIATDVGGMREALANGKAGILIPQGDSRKLSDAIINYITNPEKASKKRFFAKKFARKFFSVDVMAYQYLNEYKKICPNKKKKYKFWGDVL